MLHLAILIQSSITQSLTCDIVKGLYSDSGCCFDSNAHLSTCNTPSFEGIRVGKVATFEELNIPPVHQLEEYPKFYSKLVSFGDSNVDNGLQPTTVISKPKIDNAESTQAANYKNTAASSNFKTFFQIAAETMNIPLESYAVSGGWSGSGGMPFYCDTWSFCCNPECGVMTQVERYISTNVNADPNAVYGFMVGSNDIHRAWGNQTERNERALQSTLNVKSDIEKLAGLGATTFVIGNRAVRPDPESADDNSGKYLNRLYEKLMVDLNTAHPYLTFVHLDVYSIGRRIQENTDVPSAFAKDLLVAGNITFQQSLSYGRFDAAHMAFHSHQSIANELVKKL